MKLVNSIVFIVLLTQISQLLAIDYETNISKQTNLSALDLLKQAYRQVEFHEPIDSEIIPQEKKRKIENIQTQAEKKAKCFDRQTLVNNNKELNFFEAIFKNNLDTVKLMLTLSSSPHILVNTQDLLGRTPLYCAAIYCDENMIDLLLKYGADVTISSSDKFAPTALHVACRHNTWPVVEKLLALHPIFKENIDFRASKAERTLLYIACEYGRTQTVQNLLMLGANMNFSIKVRLHGEVLTRNIANLGLSSELKKILKSHQAKNQKA